MGKMYFHSVFTLVLLYKEEIISVLYPFITICILIDADYADVTTLWMFLCTDV